MLDVLLDKSFWMGIIFIVIVCLVLFLLKKYPILRTASYIFLCICYVGLTAYCVCNLNTYYNAHGGIYGKITSLFSPTVSVEENVITVENLELVQYLDTDTYSCKIITEKTLTIDDEKEYVVYVNDIPCANTLITSDYISCDYSYQFFDEYGNLLCEDTLYIRLALNKNNSYYYIYTLNGTIASKYWSYYINNNGLIISINENSYQKSDDINYVEVEDTSYYTVKYVYTDNYSESKLYKEGSILENPTPLVGIKNWRSEDGSIFINTDINSGITTGEYIVSQDLTLYATFTDYEDLTSLKIELEGGNGAIIGSTTAEYSGLVYYEFETQKYYVVSTHGYGWNSVADYGNGVVILKSIYSDIEPVVFCESVKAIMPNPTTESISAIYFWTDGDNSWYLYAINNEEGVYLYDIKNDSNEKIYENYTWTSFEIKFNEDTSVYSSVEIRNSSNGFYLCYDFITKNLSVVDDDLDVSI